MQTRSPADIYELVGTSEAASTILRRIQDSQTLLTPRARLSTICRLTNCHPKEMEMVKRRRTWRFRLMILTIAVVGTLGFAELMLWVLGIGFPRPYIPDEYIGTRLQPGFHAWFGNEGGAHVRVNSIGFRDSEVPSQKRDGEFRIAVLGDSYVEAVQVELEQTFWKQLESRLSQSSETPVRCLGFGVSGFGTAQELLMFQHYVRPFNPDVVVLAMTLGNDVRNNSRQLEPVQERPFFTVAGERLLEDRSFLQHPAFLRAQQTSTQFKTRVINSSRILQLVAEFRSSGQQIPANSTVERGLDESVYRPPTSDEWQEAWRITEALILRLNKDVLAANARLVVVTLTEGAQVNPQPSVHEEVCREIGADDLNYGDSRIAELCRKHEILVLNLAEPMRTRALADKCYFHGFQNTSLGTGHWNQEGHRLGSQLIADFLQQHIPLTSQNVEQ